MYMPVGAGEGGADGRAVGVSVEAMEGAPDSKNEKKAMREERWKNKMKDNEGRKKEESDR